MDSASIDGVLKDPKPQSTLATLVTDQQTLFNFGNDVIFSQAYPLEPEQHYAMMDRKVRAELVISRVNGFIGFAAWMRYSGTNNPVLKELKTKSGRPVERDSIPFFYDPEQEEVTYPKFRGDEVNFSQFRNIDFSCEGLKAFVDGKGIYIEAVDEYNSLNSRAEEIKRQISQYWGENKHLSRKAKVDTTKPMWKEADELGTKARTAYAEAALRKEGADWIATFPKKLCIFIENDGRAANEGVYIQNWLRIAQTPRSFYGKH